MVFKFSSQSCSFFWGGLGFTWQGPTTTTTLPTPPWLFFPQKFWGALESINGFPFLRCLFPFFLGKQKNKKNGQKRYSSEVKQAHITQKKHVLDLEIPCGSPRFFCLKWRRFLRSSFLWGVVMSNLSFFCKSVSVFGSYMGILRTNQQKRYEVDPRSCEPQKKPPTFHNTSCLIGILAMVYYNPYITG